MEKPVKIAVFHTLFRPAGARSNTLNWTSLDLSDPPGAGDGNLHEHQVARFKADMSLLAAARSVRHLYAHGRVVEGVIGSSDVWNEGIDRINRFHFAFGTSVGEMETSSAAKFAALFKVPFLGIRVVTANVMSAGVYDPKTAEACQKYVLQVVKAYLANPCRRCCSLVLTVRCSGCERATRSSEAV